jgi:tetratricopeptide (TPR) repeat protein
MVRINASLVLASDGSTLWSERYDRAYVDLFKLQDDITNAVASALRAKLFASPAAATQTDRPPSGDLAAYDAYMRGRFFDELRTHEDFAKAFGFFAEATKRDPQYAQAWAAFASAKVLDAAIFLGGSEQQAAVADARRLVDRALSLAPDSAYVNAVNSRVFSSGELRLADAERAARRAVELAPTADALGELARTLAWLGDASGAKRCKGRYWRPIRTMGPPGTGCRSIWPVKDGWTKRPKRSIVQSKRLPGQRSVKRSGRWWKCSAATTCRRLHRRRSMPAGCLASDRARVRDSTRRRCRGR